MENIRAHAPAHWEIHVWKAPESYPPVIDYPEDYLPDELPQVDLVLAFGEHPGVAELVPEVVKATGARAAIAPVDREERLPRGLARQLRNWLAEMRVTCVTPNLSAPSLRPRITSAATERSTMTRTSPSSPTTLGSRNCGLWWTPRRA